MLVQYIMPSSTIPRTEYQTPRLGFWCSGFGHAIYRHRRRRISSPIVAVEPRPGHVIPIQICRRPKGGRETAKPCRGSAVACMGIGMKGDKNHLPNVETFVHSPLAWLLLAAAAGEFLFQYTGHYFFPLVRFDTQLFLARLIRR